MPNRPPVEDCLAAKHYVWRLYGHKKWFAGAVLNTDNETCVIEVRIDREKAGDDRFTTVMAHADTGVDITYVDYDPNVHKHKDNPDPEE